RSASSSRQGAGGARRCRAISRAHRWTAAGRRARSRRRRTRQRHGCRTEAISADPATQAHRRSPVRERGYRSGRGGFCVHVRLIEVDMKMRQAFYLSMPETPADHAIGPPEASVTVVEYGDFECPYCKQAAAAVTLLHKRFAGRIRFVYRHFPLEEV